MRVTAPTEHAELASGITKVDVEFCEKVRLIKYFVGFSNNFLEDEIFWVSR